MENLRRTLEDLNESENSMTKNSSFIIRKSIDGSYRKSVDCSSHSSYFQNQKKDNFYRESEDPTPEGSPENCWEGNGKDQGNSIETPSGSNSDFDEEENEYSEHLDGENLESYDPNETDTVKSGGSLGGSEGGYGGGNLMGQIARDYLYPTQGSRVGVRGKGFDSLEKGDCGELRGTREGSRVRGREGSSERDE